MAHQVEWTQDIVREFSERAMLSEDEIFVLVTRVKNIPISRQAQDLNVSESTVHRIGANLKRKYDIVQKENPEIFPVRRTSKKEKYLDEN